MQIGLNSYIHCILVEVDEANHLRCGLHSMWVFREAVNLMPVPKPLLDPDSNPNACHLSKPHMDKIHSYQEAWEPR